MHMSQELVRAKADCMMKEGGLLYQLHLGTGTLDSRMFDGHRTPLLESILPLYNSVLISLRDLPWL